MSHGSQFLPPRLSARSVISKQTVVATRGNGRDAPSADFASSAEWRRKQALQGSSLERSSGLGLDIMVDHHNGIAGLSVTMMRASPARCRSTTTRGRQASCTRQSAQCCIFVMEI
jgi:hypothetical protein